MVGSAGDAGEPKLPRGVAGLAQASVQHKGGPGNDRECAVTDGAGEGGAGARGLREGIWMRERRKACGSSQESCHATSLLRVMTGYLTGDDGL